MECPWCHKELQRVSVYGVIQTGAYILGEDSKYHETNWDESDPGDEVFYCGECGRQLPDRVVDQFLKLRED